MHDADGSTGFCACGRTVVAICGRCGEAICAVHANAMPATPQGISPDAAGRFTVAVLTAAGPTCEQCRAEIGQHALHDSVAAPRAPLPSHWLDRAIALTSDSSRSELEKLEDSQLPPTLTATHIAREFLRRIEQPPRESVPISASTVLRRPKYVDGWTVDCRCTEYIGGGQGRRYKLPCLISIHGELLGPVLEHDGHASATWSVVDESDIDLARLVASVANILIISAFVPQRPPV